MRCPICRAEATRMFAKHGYWISECGTCHHRCADITAPEDHIARVYSDQYFFAGGAGYRDYLAEGPLLMAQGRRYGTLLTRYMTPGKVLDVGAAAGFILKGLEESGWRGEGVEPNASMAAYARSDLKVNVTAGAFEQLATNVVFDAVTMIQVVAHFLDPSLAFGRASGLLRPGGYLLVETWNYASWTARLFGSRWHEYSPPSVVQWFTPDSLCRLAQQHALREVARGKPKKLLTGQHAKSLLAYLLGNSFLGRLGSRAVNVVPDTWMLPYPAEDLFWSLFQRQPLGITSAMTCSAKHGGDRHGA